jgi:hypothetical protein
MKANFDLIPFAIDTAPAISIMGEIERQQNQLTIEYQLTGQIIIPPTVNNPTRQFDLWEHTCCEFFIGLKDSTQYWEFNLSPAGHWNVYRFLDYRENLLEETAFDTLPFEVLQENDNLQLNLKIDLQRIIPPEQSLEVGVTAVIKDRASQLSYWALTHPGKEADFHDRDAFTIYLDN